MAERGTDQYLAERYPGTGGDPRPLRAGEKPLDSWQSPVEMVPSHGQPRSAWRQRITSEARSTPAARPQPAPAPEPQTAESAAYDRERGGGALPPISRGGRQ